MADCKKPTAGFWITVALVAALVGYPLSFGPACWLAIWQPRLTAPVAYAYWPLMNVTKACGVRGWFAVYGGIFASNGDDRLVLLKIVHFILE